MGDRACVIIPNYNGSRTIGKCLEAVYAMDYDDFEVIVVDDCSEDNSVEIVKSFPCKLIKLQRQSGSSIARNIGALNSDAGILLFTDSDCLPEKDFLPLAIKTLREKGPGAVVGGTYTRKPCDKDFFSLFQSVFINYSETKNSDSPNYIAAHAMVIYAEDFRKTGCFPEHFLPIIEDVEFSHRLRRLGHRLFINPEMLVRHIFNFSLYKSMRNAMKKSMFWMIYSLDNKDLFDDSGTASLELKCNGASFILGLTVLLFYAFFLKTAILGLLLPIYAVNVIVNTGLLKAFYATGGLFFALRSAVYYLLIYPLAVGAGVAAGTIIYALNLGSLDKISDKLA